MKSILPNLSQYKIVLGSNSPRRRELLAGLDIDFEVQTIPDIDESFPKTLRSDEVPVYIARKKAEAYISSMSVSYTHLIRYIFRRRHHIVQRVIILACFLSVHRTVRWFH